MPTRPTGTVTFLFTDIEGSTRLAQQHPAAWPAAQARHHAIIQSEVEAHNGHTFQIIGDAFCAAFHNAPDALAAALDAQRALSAEAWGDAAIRVRMGLHTGAATARDNGDYEGYLTLVRVQRIMAVAGGDQVLISEDTYALAHRETPAGVSFADLGTHRLKDLSVTEHLYQVSALGLRADFAPLKSASHPNNLPTQLTSFVGREAEITEVRRQLDGTRLLTLTGAGGVGKTRLVLQVAAAELPKFGDGVWLAELAPLDDPTLIANTIASAVGVREEPNRPMLATLNDYFRCRSALLVLDNCEHLIADAAQACDSLLHAAPHLTIIATSREALGIAGEHAYRVPPLEIPNPDIQAPNSKSQISIQELGRCASVQLFATRAQAARNDFALTAANAPFVAQICRRLDGIPLAIELAAARARGMTVEQIAARLDDRFRILTGGSRTALPRQQTLRAAIDWSYRLLTEPEKTLLRRLSVFAGGWTLDAAEAVCSSQTSDANSEEHSPAVEDWLLKSENVLDVMTRLVDRSLVVLDESGEEPRYRMLETIRQFAHEALDHTDEAAHVRDRHLRFFIRMAEAIQPQGSGMMPRGALRRLRSDVDNFRAALNWSSSGSPIEGMQLATLIASGLNRLGYGTEVYHWTVLFLGRTPDEPSRSRARALSYAGWFESTFLDGASAARPRFERCIEICRALDDQRELAFTLIYSLPALLWSDPATAKANVEEGVRIAQAIGDYSLEARGHNQMGELARELGRLQEAQEQYERCLSVFNAEREADPLPINTLSNLVFVLLRMGDFQRARLYCRQGLMTVRGLDAPRLSAMALVACAGMLALGDAPLAAVRLLGSSAAILERGRILLEHIDQADYDRYLALTRSQVGLAAFEAAYAEGYATSPDEAITYALESCEA